MLKYVVKVSDAEELAGPDADDTRHGRTVACPYADDERADDEFACPDADDERRTMNKRWILALKLRVH